MVLLFCKRWWLRGPYVTMRGLLQVRRRRKGGGGGWKIRFRMPAAVKDYISFTAVREVRGVSVE